MEANSVTNKEGDGDVALSVTANGANMAFEECRFDECADLLNQLLLKKGAHDPKVLHNIALLGYFKDGCSDLKKLLKEFENVKKRSGELSHASGEHADSVSNMGSLLVMFNMAVIGFSLHEYDKADSLLKSLYQKIEAVEKEVAIKVCLLFLDVALKTQDPQRFLDVIADMENVLRVGNSSSHIDHGSSIQVSSNLITKSSSLPSNEAVTDASNSDVVANTNASEGSPLSRTQSEENLETLISKIDMNGQNPTREYVVKSGNDYIKTPTDPCILTSDLRPKLQLYKVQFLLLTRNLKAAKREIKTAMPMNACGKDSTVALLLKSQREYDRGNYSKAIKLLMASSQNDVGMSIIHHNNLGCIYYRLGKYHTSSIFFSKALSMASSLRKEKPLKLSTLSQDTSLEIIYNCGIQYLARGEPILAARCFKKASLLFYNRPLLWLRIAECCLLALDKGLITSGDIQDGSEIKVQVIGEGKWRHFVVETGGFGGKPDLVLGDDKEPKLSLPKARQCLLNALYLLDTSESKLNKSEENEITEAQPKISNNKNVASGDSKTSNLKVSSGQINSNGDGKEQKGGNNPNAALLNSIVYYEDIRRIENHILRQTLLADLAFVELELGNPLKALPIARSLLKLKDCSKIYVFLGNVYAAESLCLLNRPMEAADLLLTYLSSENKFQLPYSEEDCEKWRVVKTMDCEDQIVRNSAPDELQEVVIINPEEACGTLYVNRAVLFVLLGDMEQARQLANEGLSRLPNSRDAIITAIFVDLAMGNTRAAVARLKECSHIQFLPNKLKLKSSC